MDKRNMRIGDFVRDPEQNDNLIVTLNEIGYSELFEGIPLNRRFFDKNTFNVDTTTGNESAFRGTTIERSRTSSRSFTFVNCPGNNFWFGLDSSARTPNVPVFGSTSGSAKSTIPFTGYSESSAKVTVTVGCHKRSCHIFNQHFRHV